MTSTDEQYVVPLLHGRHVHISDSVGLRNNIVVISKLQVMYL